jgi:ABC-type branched-subunit amino acid transport system substrate-binding protein
VPQTIQLTRQLVEQDHVFAIFNTVGTDNALAIRSYLNEQKVPGLFAGSGVSSLATDHKRYPWTMGYLPSFVGEGVIYGRRIASAAPRAKIAVLYENSDFGKDLLNGLKRGLHGKGKLVATQSYEVADTSIDAQMARLRASKADTLMLFATPKFAIFGYVGAARLGWDPTIYVSSVSPSPDVMKIARLSAPKQVNGSMSIAFVKDPTQKVFAKDKTVKLYHSILDRFMPGAKFLDVYNYYGMAVAYTMVDALRHAGKNPTRASLLRAATHLNESNPFLLPGIRVRTSPSDYYPLDKARLIRYSNGHWIFGKLVNAQG